MASGRKPHLAKHWHSALSLLQMENLMALVNKVYRGDNLSNEEKRAVQNMIAVVVDTGYERRERTELTAVEKRKLGMSRAISSAVRDPAWLRCLNELEVANQSEIAV